MPTTSTSPEKLSQKPRLSNGAVIATAVASVIAGIVLIAGILICLFCWRRRKRDQPFEHNTPNAYPQRNPSVLSKAGLLGARASLHGVDSYDTTSPVSERRNSRPVVFDQRLNPNAFMQHDDGSRTSVVTMQDNRDYTRTLNVSVIRHHLLFLTDLLIQIRNPDPPTRTPKDE
jgi:cell wall integrity and stress response component